MFKDDSPEIQRSISIEYISNVYKNHIKIYTDGSKTQSGAGFSFYVPWLSIRKAISCSGIHSPFHIELMAIHYALLWVLDNSTILNTVIILTDCLSALQAINNFQCNNANKMTTEIVNAINQAEVYGTEITLAWVPGHAGIPGNEEADGLARSVASTEMPPINDTSITKGDAKAHIKEHCMRLWDGKYTQTEKGSHYKIFQPYVMQSLPSSSNRLANPILFRLQSGVGLRGL